MHNMPGIIKLGVGQHLSGRLQVQCGQHRTRRRPVQQLRSKHIQGGSRQRGVYTLPGIIKLGVGQQLSGRLQVQRWVYW